MNIYLFIFISSLFFTGQHKNVQAWVIFICLQNASDLGINSKEPEYVEFLGRGI